MNKIKLSEQILNCTYRLVVLYKGELISDGTGVCYHPMGRILTAWHVIDPRMKFMDQAYLKDPALEIYALSAIGDEHYRVDFAIAGYELDVGRGMKDPFRVDLAAGQLLGLRQTVPFLKLSDEIVPVGTEVLMCGFPDEMEFPFRMDQNIDWTGVEGGPRTETEMKIFKNLPLIRSGMVGHVSRMKMGIGQMEIGDTSFNSQFEGAYYWIDNVSNLGASGGPVVTRDGKMIGTILQRGETSVPGSNRRPEMIGDSMTTGPTLQKGEAPRLDQDGMEFKVPSGSTIAISSGFVTWMNGLVE